jgi:hypothetical protein
VKFAIFSGASIDECNFDHSVGLPRARALETSRILAGQDITGSIETYTLSWVDKIAPWHRLRIIGRLPLFAPSYLATALLLAYLGVLSYWNDWVTHTTETLTPLSAANENAEMFLAVLSKKFNMEPPTLTFLFLISTISLGVGSTLYLLFCPSRVQSFNIDEWRFAHDKPLILYLASSWRLPFVRVWCAIAYLIGGLLALYVIGYNLVRYMYYIAQQFGLLGLF